MDGAHRNIAEKLSGEEGGIKKIVPSFRIEGVKERSTLSLAILISAFD